MTITSILTIGGMALAGALIDTSLEIMGKENLSKIIRLLIFVGLGFYSVTYISEFLTLVSRTFL